MADLIFEQRVEGHARFHVFTLQVEKLVPVLGSLDCSQFRRVEERSDNSPKIARILLGCLFFHDEPKDVVITD